MNLFMTERSTRLRLLLADDHPVVLEGLAAIFATEDAFEVVGRAFDGDDACNQFDALRPDVLILDLRMPVLGGLPAVMRLIAVHPQARILIMTTYDTDEDVWRCLREGALGYILKDARHQEIFAAVRSVARGEPYTTPRLAVQLAQRSRRPELTARERATLSLLATGSSNKDIATRLHMSEGTVKSHLKHIYEKLNVTSRGEAAALARQRGLAEP